MTSGKQNFLFLQGPATPFFSRLGRKLKQHGHQVIKVNFNGGDCLYWSAGDTVIFNNTPEHLPELIFQLHSTQQLTDLVLFGDCRPLHQAALKAARKLGLRSHIFEEGYLRPFWITLEREGVNGHSLLPRNPEWFLQAAGRLSAAEPVKTFRSSFRKRAFHDVCYHLAGIVNGLLFSHYRTHALHAAPAEYIGYLRRFCRNPIARRQNAPVIQQLLSGQRPFFILPLQLDSDAQIREHSRFENMAAVMDVVIGSFSRHAPADSMLVIKSHPLDYSGFGYGRLIRKLSQLYGVADDRLIFIESGNLDHLCTQAVGMVTVNSTAGMVALEHQCPVLTLSDPIYNLPGLTWQGELDTFWQHATQKTIAIDTALYQAFRAVVLAVTQVNGGFYCRTGIEYAVDNALKWLQEGQSPLDRLLSTCTSVSTIPLSDTLSSDGGRC